MVPPAIAERIMSKELFGYRETSSQRSSGRAA
jgi:hypothetical protein